jgi:hypothetical protein
LSSPSGGWLLVAHPRAPRRAEAAAERIERLERHLELCQQARIAHLGGTP